jgi:hypothetical protein
MMNIPAKEVMVMVMVWSWQMMCVCWGGRRQVMHAYGVVWY